MNPYILPTLAQKQRHHNLATLKFRDIIKAFCDHRLRRRWKTLSRAYVPQISNNHGQTWESLKAVIVVFWVQKTMIIDFDFAIKPNPVAVVVQINLYFGAISRAIVGIYVTNSIHLSSCCSWSPLC